MFKLLSVITVLLTSFGSHAQTGADIQPGMWEYQMEAKMPGMPNMPPTTIKRCLTAQDVAQNKHLTNDQGKNPCTISNMKSSGGKVSYDFSCKTEQSSVKGSSSGSASGTAMDIQTRMLMTMPGQQGSMEMQQKMKARRLGAC